MNKNKGKKRIAFVLTGGYLIGGAETRFINAFKYLKDNCSDFEFYCILSGKKFVSLYKHNLADLSQKGIILNCPLSYLKVLGYCFDKSFHASMGEEEEEKFILLSFFKKAKKRLMLWFYFIYNIFFILFCVKVKKIDVLHPVTHGSPPCGVVKVLSPATRLVSTFLTVKPTSQKKGLYYLCTSQYLALKKADWIDVLGQSYLEALKSVNIPLDIAKISITKCSFIIPFKTEKQKQKIVVFSGRLEEQKNPVLFTEAAKIVIELGFDDVNFLVLGSGPLKNKLENMIREYNIGKNVKIKYCFDQSEVLSKSLVFCSLQEKDNYPSQSLMQAMFAKNGIIATDFGETQKLVKHRENGFLVKPDPVEVANRIMFFLNNDKQRELMGKKACESVKKNHNILRFTEYLTSLYRNLD